MDAKRFALEKRNFGCTIVRLATVLGLIVGDIGQNGQLSRHRFVGGF